MKCYWTIIDKQVREWVGKGVISKVDTQPKIVLQLGIVPKKNNKWRVIIDMREVNKYIIASKF